MSSEIESVQPVLGSRDVEASIAFYRRLGFEAVFRDEPVNPKYAAVRRDGVELHLQWHESREWELPGDRPTYRFVARDVDALYEEFKASGALSVNSVVRATPWGTREFHVHDLDRNGLQFYRAL